MKKLMILKAYFTICINFMYLQPCVRYSDNSTGEEKKLKKKLSDAISIIQEQDKLIHQGTV